MAVPFHWLFSVLKSKTLRMNSWMADSVPRTYRVAVAFCRTAFQVLKWGSISLLTMMAIWLSVGNWLGKRAVEREKAAWVEAGNDPEIVFARYPDHDGNPAADEILRLGVKLGSRYCKNGLESAPPLGKVAERRLSELGWFTYPDHGGSSSDGWSHLYKDIILAPSLDAGPLPEKYERFVRDYSGTLDELVAKLDSGQKPVWPQRLTERRKNRSPNLLCIREVGAVLAVRAYSQIESGDVRGSQLTLGALHQLSISLTARAERSSPSLSFLFSRLEQGVLRKLALRAGPRSDRFEQPDYLAMYYEQTPMIQSWRFEDAERKFSWQPDDGARRSAIDRGCRVLLQPASKFAFANFNSRFRTGLDATRQLNPCQFDAREFGRRADIKSADWTIIRLISEYPDSGDFNQGEWNVLGRLKRHKLASELTSLLISNPGLSRGTASVVVSSEVCPGESWRVEYRPDGKVTSIKFSRAVPSPDPTVTELPIEYPENKDETREQLRRD